MPVGDQKQSFDDYVRQLSSTTGMPHTLLPARTRRRSTARSTRSTSIVAGLTRGFDLSILDRGFGDDDGRMLSWFREARTFGAVLPSNSPGVHSLWIPAVALKTPIVLKPGREEPWSPLRIIQSFIAAGVPAEAFGFYPTDHGGSATILQDVDRAMLFGDASHDQGLGPRPARRAARPRLQQGHPRRRRGRRMGEVPRRDRVQASPPTAAARASTPAPSGRPKNADKIAEAIAEKLATCKALPADDPDAQIAAFANPTMPERMNAMIDGR